ncbi:MAG: HEAT repeat domain-containing protein [Bacteroidales bacterium]|nr:HEAT repeat domain-containing protein [Bacteroidales bacterium]MCB9000009.1 HEAT repeat domain-containing protein [Bacteroidales bacterium]MCB9013261.1 HEAT repeat domain-containing protein [Bacteroidales bacterium]
MENKDETQKNLLAGLSSPDENTISETIQELRIHGNVKLLPDLINLLFTSKSEMVREGLTGLLNDIKDPAAVPIFMEAVNKYRKSDGLDLLVSACWQCGLDFSEYIDEFIEMVISEKEYYTSIEAFSVVEENSMNLNSQQRTARYEMVRSRLESVPQEKRKLVNELLSILSNVSGPVRIDPDLLN